MRYVSLRLKLLFLLPAVTAVVPVTILGQTATHLVISQAFGGGGITPGLYANDFVELYNPTSGSVSVAGWSIQYALGTSTIWLVTNLSGAVPAKSYFLIKLGTNNAAIGTALPTPDVTGSTNISSVNIKVGLVNSTTILSGTNPSASCVDFIGTGTANGFEGTGAAPAGSNSVSWLRLANASATAVSMASGGADANSGNGYDANNNSTDVVTESSILARNSSVAAILPVVFTNLQAFQKESSIQVQWTVAGEIGIGRYTVQKSIDGSTFNDAGVITINARYPTSFYEWIDQAPTPGIQNYYRIKAEELTGNMLYSIVISMSMGPGKSGVAVYPNPVPGQTIQVALNNEPKGNYAITLFNFTGQAVYRRIIEHAGGSEIQQLVIRALAVKGIYSLKVSNGITTISKVLISQ